MYKEVECCCSEVGVRGGGGSAVCLPPELCPPQMQPLDCCSDNGEVLCSSIHILLPIPSWGPVASI